jgi:hypothetical protein
MRNHSRHRTGAPMFTQGGRGWRSAGPHHVCCGTVMRRVAGPNPQATALTRFPRRVTISLFQARLAQPANAAVRHAQRHLLRFPALPHSQQAQIRMALSSQMRGARCAAPRQAFKGMPVVGRGRVIAQVRTRRAGPPIGAGLRGARSRCSSTISPTPPACGGRWGALDAATASRSWPAIHLRRASATT